MTFANTKGHNCLCVFSSKLAVAKKLIDLKVGCQENYCTFR